MLRPLSLQSVDEVVDDLYAWLQTSGEKAAFILVGHSNSGIYARRFITRYPREGAGLVFVDSSHEEQALRLRELDPAGPGLNDVTALIGFYVKPGQRLKWRTDLPLIVLGRGVHPGGLKNTAFAKAFLASPLFSPTWMRRRSSTLL